MLPECLRKTLSWMMAPSFLGCTARHPSWNGDGTPKKNYDHATSGAGSLTEPQRAALDHFASLCKEAKISRLHVSRDGVVVEQRTLDLRASASSDVMSVTKAISGMIVGCALRETQASKKIFLKSFLSDMPSQFESVTVWDLLHHTSAIRLGTEDEVGCVYRSTNIVTLVKQARLDGNVGETVRYSNVAVNLLNPLLQTMSGMSIQEFAQKKLFSPLGIHHVLWEGDTSGNQYIMAGLHLRVEDLAKIGGLLFSGGRHRGRQIVPESWISSLWVPTSVVHKDAIGERVSWSNLWAQTYVVAPPVNQDGTPVIPPDSLSASGFGGQFIVALRRSRLLIVSQRDMELNDTKPYLGGEDFSRSLDQLDLVFSLSTEGHISPSD